MTIRRNKQVVFTGMRGWKQLTVELGPGLDINKAPYYVLELRGLRHDDAPFRVAVDIDKSIDRAPGQVALEVAVRGIQQNLAALHTFRDCECGPQRSCKAHSTNSHAPEESHERT